MRRDDLSKTGWSNLNRGWLTWGPFLVLLWAASLGVTVSAAELVGTAKWESEIRAYEASDRTNAAPPGGVLFVGSSSIRLWKRLAEDFPQWPVINRGFGGSQIVDSIYFADRIITPYRPRAVVFYGGGNDLNAGKTPEQVSGDFCALVAKIQAALPGIRIVYVSIAGTPARWAQVDRVRETNRRIREFCLTRDDLVYVDVFSRMLGTDGLPKPDIFVEDRLHLNEKGYAIWRELIGPHLPAPAESGAP